jgi:hypothetical protein
MHAIASRQKMEFFVFVTILFSEAKMTMLFLLHAFGMSELLIQALEDAENILVDETTKRSWLNKTLMTSK